MRLEQNGRHFADGIFKCMFLNGNVWKAHKLSLQYILVGLNDDISVSLDIMAWFREGTGYINPQNRRQAGAKP